MTMFSTALRRPARVSLAPCLLAASCLAVACCGPAEAQGPPAPGGSQDLPFAGVVRRPSLSPYNSLAFQGNNPTTGATLGALQGLLRPQQEQYAQRQQAAGQSRQLRQLQGDVRQIQRSPSRMTIETIRATGHASTYQNLSHYYTQPRVNR